MSDTWGAGPCTVRHREQAMSAAANELTLADLDHLIRWLIWRNERLDEDRPNRLTKVPYQALRPSAKASSTNPKHWSSRAAAEKAAPLLVNGLGGGVGIALGAINATRAIGGIDFDTCRQPDGTFDPQTRDVIELFATYTEISPSGTGAKSLFAYDPAAVAELRRLGLLEQSAFGRQFKRGGGEHPSSIELFLSHRYFTLTFDRLPDAPETLRIIPTELLIELLQAIGPAFAKSADKPSGERYNKS